MTKKVIFFVLLAFILVFVIQNTQMVDFQILLWRVSMSRALLLLVSFGIGLIVGLLSKRPRSKRNKKA